MVWWAGQDFGILGGMGTDPNTVPLVALLMVVGAVLDGAALPSSQDMLKILDGAWRKVARALHLSDAATEG